MLQSADKVASLICDYLRSRGFVLFIDLPFVFSFWFFENWFFQTKRFSKSFAAVAEEAGLDIEEIPRSKPCLTEILDEWSELRGMFDATSAGRHDDDGLSAPSDLESALSEASRSAPAVDVVSLHSAKSAILCCVFDEHNRLIWGEASRLLHFQDRGDMILGDTTSGGVLSLAVSGSTVFCGTMSGRLFASDHGSDFTALATAHAKYVHRICANKKFLVSASHDHSVMIFDVASKKMLKQLKFPTTCETLCLMNESKLLIGVRESNLLRLVDLENLEDSPVLFNLNAFGDDHVSFNVLDVSVCPANNQLLAVASDRDRVFVYWVSEASSKCQLMATLTGMCSDGMSAARCCFSPCGTLL